LGELCNRCNFAHCGALPLLSGHPPVIVPSAERIAQIATPRLCRRNTILRRFRRPLATPQNSVILSPNIWSTAPVPYRGDWVRVRQQSKAAKSGLVVFTFQTACRV